MNIVYMGSRNAGYFGLKHLIENNYDISMVVTTEDTPNAWYKSVKTLAKKYNLPVSIPKKIKNIDFINSIVKLKPDIIFSMYYDKIIPKKILESSKYNINFHGGLLPKYKGCVSSAWAIINNEKETAVTAHIMDPGIDTGDIIKIKKIKIEFYDTGRTLYDKVSEAAVELFKELLPIIEKKELITYPQTEKGNYYSRKLPYDGIIDWEKENLNIYNYIRAMNFPPFKPAKTYYQGKELYVWDSEIIENDNKKSKIVKDLKSGTIVDFSSEGFFVKTKNDKLLIKKINIDKQNMSAIEFLSSYNIKIGDRLYSKK